MTTHPTPDQINDRLAREVMGWEPRYYLGDTLEDGDSKDKWVDVDESRKPPEKTVALMNDWNPWEDLNQAVRCLEELKRRNKIDHTELTYTNNIIGSLWTTKIYLNNPKKIFNCLSYESLSQAICLSIWRVLEERK